MKRQVGRLIYPDGSDKIVWPHDGKEFSLSELQGFVGGYIERVQLKPGNGHAIMYINEEGKLEGLALNQAATDLTNLWPYDVIVGPAIIVSREKK